MNPRAIRLTVLVGDLVWIAFSALVAFMFRTSSAWDVAHLQIALRESVFLMTAGALAWMLVSQRLRLDGFYGGYEVPAMLSQLFTGTVALVVLLASFGFLLNRASSRLLLATFAALFFGAAFAGRLLARSLARSLAGQGRRHRVLILGKGRVAQELAARIQRHPELRWELVGFLFPSAGDFVDPLLYAGASAQLNSLRIDALLKEQRVNEVLLTAPVPDQGEMLNLVANCRQLGIRVSIVPNLYQLYVNRPALLDLDGLPLLRIGEGKPTMAQSALKRASDLALSLVLVLAVSPLLALCAILLRIQKGKALISAPRCGRNGRVFQMFRFNCDRDVSATTLERVLQTMGLSELPQLWNVMKGEMSLVGPRPETEERVKRYSDWQRQRLICKPGMAGLAQVHGLREENASEDKAYYDLRYIQDWSLLTDLSLILQTAWTILHRCFQAKPAVVTVPDTPLAEDTSALIEFVHADRS
jgi:lipopolysaccharide/colanic/teichoic acid biosynthesis glycosyltransferase